MSQEDPQAAMLRAYVACNLLQKVLPDLPAETARALEELLAQFCRIVGEELQKTHPAPTSD